MLVGLNIGINTVQANRLNVIKNQASFGSAAPTQYKLFALKHSVFELYG